MTRSIYKILIVCLIALIPTISQADTGTVHIVNTGNGTIEIIGGTPYTLTVNSGESIDFAYNTENETFFTVSDNFNKACFSMDCSALDDNRNTELDINDPYYYDVYPTEIIFFFNEV